MDIEEAIELVKENLNPSRFDHTIRVMETSETLASTFGAPLDEVKLAAVFHDFAKNWSGEQLKNYILTHDLPKDLLDFDKELWHGPVGAHVLEEEHGITNQDILGAVRCHTTGKAGMNQVEMIVYLADYIEPGRSFPGLEEVRKMSEKNLEFACFMVARNNLMYLLGKNVTIHPDSFHAYNDLTRYIQMEGLLDG